MGVRQCKNLFVYVISMLYPLKPGVAFLYSLKTSENLKMFSWGVEKQHWAVMG